MKQTASGTYVLEDRWPDYAWLSDVLGDALASTGVSEIGIDVETRTARKDAKTPDPRRDTLVGVGLGVAIAAAEYLPVYGLATAGYLEVLKQHLGTAGWFAHNAMFDATVLYRYGIKLGEHKGDPRIIAYLLGEPDADLKSLLWRWMQYPVQYYEEVLDAWDAANIAEVPVEVQADYCALQDAVQCVRLERLMRAQLPPRSLQVYTGLELPMVQILIEMSETGIRFDRDAAQPMFDRESAGVAGLDKIIQQQVAATGFKQWEIRNGSLWYPTCKACRNGKNKRVSCLACGGRGKDNPVERSFNPGSSDQLREWLYTHLGAPVRRYAGGASPWQARQIENETGTHPEPSTDSLALLQLQGFHATLPIIIARRKVQKRVGFLSSWLEKAAEDGRLHTQFTNTKVVSGRLSSREPNLTQVTQDLRGLFTADPSTAIEQAQPTAIEPKTCLVAADMSQLEIRIAGYMSRDPLMLDILRNGRDMHCVMAQAVYGTPDEKRLKEGGSITDAMRNTAKVGNYEAGYGGGWMKLVEIVEKMVLSDTSSSSSSGLHVPTPDEAKEILKTHKRLFKGYWEWVGWTIQHARINGYSVTAFGRPRYSEDINSQAEKYRLEAERALVNHTIQGCLPARARILTRTGWRRIGDWQQGEIWTGAEWAYAEKLDRGDAQGRTLYLSDGRTFSCDERHELLVQDSAWPRWVKVDDAVGLPLVRDNESNWGESSRDPEAWYWTGRTGARGKRIPDTVFQLDRVSRQRFFDGYFDADGHEGTRSSKLTSVNRALLEDMLRLMQTLGMTGKISSPMKNGKGLIWYDLYIHASPHPLVIERVEVAPYERMYTLAVQHERHAFSSEGLISKNTAADLMKMAMINITKDTLMCERGAMLLQVHDEIVSKVLADWVKWYEQRIALHMQLGQPFKPYVNLVVDVNSAFRWKDCHK